MCMSLEYGHEIALGTYDQFVFNNKQQITFGSQRWSINAQDIVLSSLEIYPLLRYCHQFVCISKNNFMVTFK